MNFLDSHDLLISTLSPVHVGCGEDYEPTNYVIDTATKMLHVFDPALLLTKLEPQHREEISRALDQPNPLIALQRFFYRNKQLACDIARFKAPVVEAAARFYETRVGQVANRATGDGNVINKLEIARTAYNPVSNLPVLPGSSLKGAMRTAVLESLRKATGRRYPLTDQEAQRQNEAARKSKEMERDLLAGSFQTDPLRLLKVADASFRPGSYKAKNLKGEEIQRERQARSLLFQTNRKKRPNQFTASGKIETLVECIPPGQPSAFAGRMTIERKADLGESTPRLQLCFASIARACNDFYIPRLELELQLLEQHQYASQTWINNARARLDHGGLWGKAIAGGRGFLLRVGRHSGAESVTIDAPRRIKISKGKGQPVEWAPEATTLWLATTDPDSTGNMVPFGWVFVQTK